MNFDQLIFQDGFKKRKHDIAFQEARDAIFESRNLLAIEVAYQDSEPRHAVIGRCRDKFYTGIFTIRDGTIRIISVRRSRREEEEQARRAGI